MLWERYQQYHEMITFATMDTLMEDHASWEKDFEKGLREEYISKEYDQFLVQLSWSDLPYRYATKSLVETAGPVAVNPYVSAFMEQFEQLDTDRKAGFLFPESFVSQFFVIAEVCKRAEEFHPVRNLFPDEEKVHYLAVFDKQKMDDVLLMYHLLYTNTSQEVFGGYSLYDYSLPWYQTHLREDGIVLRSPYLPDRIAKYQGNLPYYYNPSKTVYVRRNIEHILECGCDAGPVSGLRRRSPGQRIDQCRFSDIRDTGHHYADHAGADPLPSVPFQLGSTGCLDFRNNLFLYTAFPGIQSQCFQPLLPVESTPPPCALRIGQIRLVQDQKAGFLCTHGLNIRISPRKRNTRIDQFHDQINELQIILHLPLGFGHMTGIPLNIHDQSTPSFRSGFMRNHIFPAIRFLRTLPTEA